MTVNLEKQSESKRATVKEVKDFFGMSLTEMKEEWSGGNLSDAEKEQIAVGIGNGSLTY